MPLLLARESPVGAGEDGWPVGTGDDGKRTGDEGWLESPIEPLRS